MLPTRQADCLDVTLSGLTTGAQQRTIRHPSQHYGPGSIHGEAVLGRSSMPRIACLNRHC